MKKKTRTHQAHWKDSTITQRQSKRREQLNQKAMQAGYSSWSAYETSVINGETHLTPLAQDGGVRPAKNH
jgi:hypothetical protein